MSRQYEKTGEIMNEHDYLMDVKKYGGCYSPEDAQRACRIARIRGEMKGAKECGCWGTYDNLRLRLKSILKGINKRQQQ